MFSFSFAGESYPDFFWINEINNPAVRWEISDYFHRV